MGEGEVASGGSEREVGNCKVERPNRRPQVSASFLSDFVQTAERLQPKRVSKIAFLFPGKYLTAGLYISLNS